MSKKNLACRQCSVTHELISKNELIRICKIDGQVFVDIKQSMGGRGCYLKKDKKVIDIARKAHTLNQRLRTNVNDDIYLQLLNLFK